MPGRTAESMEQAIKIFVTNSEKRNVSLGFTVDRGKNFSCLKEVERDLATPMYFCAPYSSWK